MDWAGKTFRPENLALIYISLNYRSSELRIGILRLTGKGNSKLLLYRFRIKTHLISYHFILLEEITT
jgi:hypothetical protein